MLVAGVIATLPGCGLFERPQRPAWREAADKACMARRTVRMNAYVQPARAIDGPGICGLNQPLKVAALKDGTVAISSTATLNCPMAEALEKWMLDVVQPAAWARFKQPVTQIDTMGSYGCRPINNKSGAKLSEHAFGNAIDIGGFRLADGRSVTLLKGWTKGDEQEKGFLREAHIGACDHFTTVLGPGSNALHANHFHVDLAMHGNTSQGPRRYCRPILRELPPRPRLDDLPDPPMLEPEIDMARSMGGNRNQVAASRQATAALVRPAPAPLAPMGSMGRYGGRMGLDIAAPLQMPQRQPALAARGGMLRDDGVFVPPGEIGD
jgi:hypothetical protein